jgi:LAO/AO transport system kinase
MAAAEAGDRLALARLLSLVERGGPTSLEVAALAYRGPVPYTVGLTGAPGSGKSTLTDRLITEARRGWPALDGDADEHRAAGAAGDADEHRAAGAAGHAHEHRAGEPVDQVAVLAVDPTSPFSGGAILGDRVRMQDHATDPTVYIRSMATRGHLGGLAQAVPDAVRVLGAAGFPLVLVETVGVGQIEVEVASAADTTLVVVTPGWGDSIQASKAGLLEVADIFVVNKADRPGVSEARRDLQQMLDLARPGDWRPPVVPAVATTADGVREVWEEVARHRRLLLDKGLLEERRTERLARELRRVLAARMAQQVHALTGGEAFDECVGAMAARRLDPYQAADRLLGEWDGPASDTAVRE